MLGNKLYHYNSNPEVGITSDILNQWERGLFKAITEFNTKSKYLEFSGICDSGIDDGFNDDIERDFSFVGASVVLLVTYCVLNLGSWSPIHFRSFGAFITLLCVVLCYGGSNGLSFLFGFKSSRMH